MFRGIKLLKQLKHENIRLFISSSEDIYLVTELMTTDIHTFLKTKIIDNQFAQYFLYQILRDSKYVYSADIIHRDLKASNILVHENCDQKICDFGLAPAQESQMTGYVSTRYYRVSEIMLTWRRYNEKVDIWSTLKFILSLPKRLRKPLSKLIPGTNAKANALLGKLFQIDPDQRCLAEGLKLQYLAQYHDPDDEPNSAEKFDWLFSEANLPADVWKFIIYDEVLGYHESAGGSKTHTASRQIREKPFSRPTCCCSVDNLR
ncbi:hypothetical protein N7451_012239 [Penicillium sp. IBT 35674x]|nr:hypothetical protein N7451_012239 [Penicillium sp. IBT 35674x]